MKNLNNKNTIDDSPLTDVDYEGVVYEASNNINKKDISKNSEIKNKPKKIKKAQDFNFNIFLGATIGIAIIIFGVVSYMSYNILADYINLPSYTKQEEPFNLNANSSSAKDEFLNSIAPQNLSGIIKNIDFEKGIFTIIELETSYEHTLKSKSSSVYRDKYDNPLTIVELEKGDIVDFSIDSVNKINYINQSKLSFTYKNITNVDISLENNTLTVNNKTFNINQSTIVTRNDETYSIEKISPLDTISIKGLNNNIYFIEIVSGNGTLVLENKSNLSNGIIQIDRNIFKSLNEIDSINLSEGTHKVIITSDDTTSFIKEIDIKSGEETILDLSILQNKTGTLILKSNVSDYTLYINGNLETSREPLTLQYGAYSIRVQKEGYTPFESQFSINKSQNTLEINLEKIEKVGKLTLSSSPETAEVYVDNIFVGYTPLTYKVEQGVHNVTLKKDGYNDFVLSSVNIGDDETSFNITMHESVSETTESTETTTVETTENTETTTD